MSEKQGVETYIVDATFINARLITCKPKSVHPQIVYAINDKLKSEQYTLFLPFNSDCKNCSINIEDGLKSSCTQSKVCTHFYLFFYHVNIFLQNPNQN